MLVSRFLTFSRRALVVTAAAAAGSLAVVPSGSAAPQSDAPLLATHGHGSSDGELVFSRFDPVLNDLVPIVVNPDGRDEHQVYPYAMECPQWSPDGSMLASCGVPSFVDPNGAGTTILNVDTGVATYHPFLPGLFSLCYVWSLDQKRLACDAGSDSDPATHGIWTVRIHGWDRIRQVTSNPGGEDVPGSYSPDGRRIVFASYTGDPDEGGGVPLGLFVVNADGSHLRHLTPDGAQVTSSGDWSPNGERIIFSQRSTIDNRSSLWTIHPDGSGLRELHVATPTTCGGLRADPSATACFRPVWSPSGRRIAFDYGDSDGTHVWIAAACGRDAKNLADDAEGPLDWGSHGS